MALGFDEGSLIARIARRRLAFESRPRPILTLSRREMVSALRASDRRRLGRASVALSDGHPNLRS
ncbi:MAG: hypothetical protein C4334_08835 [Pyrinomonas sp.]